SVRPCRTVAVAGHFQDRELPMLKFSSLVKTLWTRQTRKSNRAGGTRTRRASFRPFLEGLETRIVPSLVIDPLNPRYFMDNATGKVVYLAGSSTWNNGQVLTGSSFDYTQYVNFLQGNNNNFFRLWVFETSKTSLPVANYAMVAVSPTIYARSTTPGANDG